MGTEIKKTTAKKPKVEPPKLSEAEIEAKRKPAEKRFLDEHFQKVRARPEPPKLKITRTREGGVSTDIAAEDMVLAQAALLASFGTNSFDLLNLLTNSIFNAACNVDEHQSFDENNVNALIAAMHGINPQDEIEGMLASQMVATHIAAMRTMRQLKNSGQINQQDSNGNLAIKLLRTFTVQMEALNRHRGKGQQKMTVEHVHVYEGGQAIVGQIASHKGGGVSRKKKGQSLAPEPKQLADGTGESELLPPLRSENAEKHTVPIPRHE